MRNKFLAIPIEAISFEKAILSPRFNIELDVYEIDGEYHASFPLFNIEITADSIESVKDDFCEDICMLWEVYAEAEDSDLTDDAIDFKKRLKEYFSLCPTTEYEIPAPTYYDFSCAGYDGAVNYGFI